MAIGVNENNYEIVSTEVQTNSESIQNISNYIYDLNMFSTENEININNMGILVDDNTNSILELTNSLSIYDKILFDIKEFMDDKKSIDSMINGPIAHVGFKRLN